MTDLVETPTWETGIYQFEITDPLQGGLNGIDNVPPGQLANRTLYLKTEHETLKASVEGDTITTPQTITVGIGQDYNTLLEAWESLKGKAILELVTIQIIDGSYAQNIILLDEQPFSQNIRIQGNLTTPASVNFIFTPDGGSKSYGLQLSNLAGLQIAGIKLSGTVGETQQLLRIQDSRLINVDAGSLELDGGDVGVWCTGGKIHCDGIKVDDCTIGLWAKSSGLIQADDIIITGRGKAIAEGYGLYAQDGGFIRGLRATINDYDYGVHALDSADIRCHSAVCTDCNQGFRASSGSVISASIEGGTEISQATNCGTGFHAKHASVILADGCIATSTALSPNAAYYCSNNSTILARSAHADNFAKGAWALNMGFIEANNTAANFTNNTANYDPATSEVLGNVNGCILFN